MRPIALFALLPLAAFAQTSAQGPATPPASAAPAAAPTAGGSPPPASWSIGAGAFNSSRFATPLSVLWVGGVFVYVPQMPSVSASLERRLSERRWAVFGVFVYNLARFVGPVLLRQSPMPLGVAVENSLTWLVWFGLLSVIGRTMGSDHPPVEAGALTPARRGVAVVCLALFILLFMPTPLANYPAAEGENLSSSAARTTSGTYRLTSPR